MRWGGEALTPDVSGPGFFRTAGPNPFSFSCGTLPSLDAAGKLLSMAQLTVAIVLPAAGVPRQVRLTFGEVVALLEQDQASKLGTQLIELAAIARSQDASSAERPLWDPHVVSG